MEGRLKVGEIYHGFIDGKISLSRLIDWKIIREFDLNKDTIDIELLSLLKQEVSNHIGLYNVEQNIIYEALAIDKDWDFKIGSCYFLKSGDNWFGTGYWACLLDVDNSMYKEAVEYYLECQKELDNQTN